MRARWGLPILQVVLATSMTSMVSAMPLPEGDTTQSAGVESAGDAVISGKSAADDLANIKDEARLPVEAPEGPASAKPRGPIEPKAVPELSRAEFCSTLAASAEKHKVPVPLFANLIWQESRFQPRAVSRVGAMGVAQFMPQVAQEVGLKNPFNPLEALPAAARFFRGLVERFGSLGLATAAYNAGSGRVDNWLAKRTKVLPKETQHYVRVITGTPVDHWRSRNGKGPTITMTAGIPCRGEAVFAKFDQADLPEQGQRVEQRVRLATMHVALRNPRHPVFARAHRIVVAAKAAVAARSKQIVGVAKVAAKPQLIALRGRKAAPVRVHGRGGRIKLAASR